MHVRQQVVAEGQVKSIFVFHFSLDVHQHFEFISFSLILCRTRLERPRLLTLSLPLPNHRRNRRTRPRSPPLHSTSQYSRAIMLPMPWPGPEVGCCPWRSRRSRKAARRETHD